ncbi:YesU family protein [Bacillus inaquosorum]|nr:YesU family protein [Bacillus inaquosorum]
MIRVSRKNGKIPRISFGDINALHLSYFRRKYAEERAFRTCNLRKSRGFHLAAMGADPRLLQTTLILRII